MMVVALWKGILFSEEKIPPRTGVNQSDAKVLPRVGFTLSG